MAAEPRPQRPGSSIRPQTRDKVVEILAGNANGCLAELGYTPALLQRVQWLEGVVTHLKNANADLLKTHTPSEERQRGDEYKRQAGELRAMYDKLQADFTEEMAKSTRYQGECLKLYEDNVKLSADCDALREQVKVAQERITAYEKTRDMNANQILEQYGNLQANYRKAVGELQWYAAEAKNASVKINTRGGGAPQPWQAQPQHRHLASTQQQQQPRRASAPQALIHPPIVPTQQGPTQQSPWQHQPQTQPPLVLTGGGFPQQYRLRPNSGPRSASGSSSAPPLPPTPTSAPPFSPYPAPVAFSATNSMGSGSGTPPVGSLPTPPMSALPLALQTFPPSAAAGPPRTGSASSASSYSQRTVAPLPGPSTSTSTSAPPPLFTAQGGVAPPPQMQQWYSFSAAPAPPVVSSSVPPTQGGVRTPVQTSTTPLQMSYHSLLSQQPVASTSAPTPPLVQETVPRLEVLTGPSQMQHSSPPSQDPGPAAPTIPSPPAAQEVAPPEMQERVAPPEVLDPASPPEAHEAITPPDSGESLKRMSLDVDGEDPRKRVRGDEDVKMEVDSAHPFAEGGDEDEDEEDEFIELGEDGLRTVPDCLAAVFPPKDGFVCRFCDARYKQDVQDGVTSEEPQSMEHAPVEEQEAHCLAEHGLAWEMLRKNV